MGPLLRNHHADYEKEALFAHILQKKKYTGSATEQAPSSTHSASSKEQHAPSDAHSPPYTVNSCPPNNVTLVVTLFTPHSNLVIKDIMLTRICKKVEGLHDLVSTHPEVDVIVLTFVRFGDGDVGSQAMGFEN